MHGVQADDNANIHLYNTHHPITARNDDVSIHALTEWQSIIYSI